MGLHQLPVDRDNHERVLGLLEQEQIALLQYSGDTQSPLTFLPVPPKIEELPLSTF